MLKIQKFRDVKKIAINSTEKWGDSHFFCRFYCENMGILTVVLDSLFHLDFVAYTICILISGTPPFTIHLKKIKLIVQKSTNVS